MSTRPMLVSGFIWLLLATGSGAMASEPALVMTMDDDRLEWGPCPEFIGEGCEIAVLHGDPAVPNVDILFKVPGDFSIPAHWHTSAERMILLSGELHVTYERQETEIISVGSYAYGPAKRQHSAYCAEGDDCVLFIAFEAPLDAHPIIEEAE